MDTALLRGSLVVGHIRHPSLSAPPTLFMVSPRPTPPSAVRLVLGLSFANLGRGSSESVLAKTAEFSFGAGACHRCIAYAFGRVMIRAYDLALAEPLETGRGLLTSFTGALHEHPDGGLGDHPGLEAVQGFGQELRNFAQETAELDASARGAGEPLYKLISRRFLGDSVGPGPELRSRSPDDKPFPSPGSFGHGLSSGHRNAKD